MEEGLTNLRWKSVIEWFGYKPNFHDAEVVSIELRRTPEPSVVRVHAWRTGCENDETGHFRQDRHAVVSFNLTGVVRQELRFWNHQNVLSRLYVTDEQDGPTLTLEGIYGVDGEIAAKEISIEIEQLSWISSRNSVHTDRPASLPICTIRGNRLP
jgi:hypothetical protein